jgi:hypothetical protein
VLRLQRSLGNRAVGRLLGAVPLRGPAIQRTRHVGFNAYELGSETMVTHGLGNCVAIAAFDPVRRRAVFAHFDTGRALDLADPHHPEPDPEKYEAIRRNMEARLGEPRTVLYFIAPGFAFAHERGRELGVKIIRTLEQVFRPVQMLRPGISASFDPLRGEITNWQTEEEAQKATGVQADQVAPRFFRDRDQGIPIRHLEYAPIGARERERRRGICLILYRHALRYRDTTGDQAMFMKVGRAMDEWFEGSPDTPFDLMAEFKRSATEGAAKGGAAR